MPHAEIPTLVVLIPLMALSLVTVLWRLRQRGALTVPRVAVGVATCVYGAGLLDQVLLPLSFSTDPSYVQQPWWVWVQVTPLITADPAGIILNVALFAPLGILLPLVARISSARGTLLATFLLSLSIELVQFVLAVTVGGGRIADIDDLLANCAGGLCGYGLFRLAVCVPIVARMAAATTWPASRHDQHGTSQQTEADDPTR